MGSGILIFYQERIKKTWKLAFYAAFWIGLMVHLYRFTNVIPNRDALYNFYSSQNILASGRWFLMIVCSPSSWFDLPWVIGLLSLAYMGVAAAIVAEVFRMENPVLIVLSSGLLVSFPAIAGTMSYEYTADGYMLAMVLAALSVQLTKMAYLKKGYWKRALLSTVCICLCCGIYQAYVSFAFVLAVCYFMTELLENRYSNRDIWKWIGTQIPVYGCALAGYYIIWKLCMVLNGVEPVGYQGIDALGPLVGSQLIRAVSLVLHNFIFFFLEWSPWVYGVTPHMIISCFFLMCFGIGTLAAIWKSGCLKRIRHLILMVLCLISLPFGCFMWYFSSEDVQYHVLMMQSLCLLYVFTGVIFDRWLRTRFSNLALLVLVAVIFNNSINANIFYNYLNQSAVKTQALAAEVSTRIHLLDDGTVKYVMFSGSLDTGYTTEEWRAWNGLRQLGGWGSQKLLYKNIFNTRYLSLYTDFTLNYYRENDLPFPIVQERDNIPAEKESQLLFPALGQEESEVLAQTPEIMEMPIWPAANAVKKVGDVIVVKFSETVQ